MVLQRFGLCLCLPVVLLSAASGRASKITMPIEPTPIPRQDINSHSGSFVLDVNPDGSGNAIYAAHDRTRPLWSLPGVLKSDVRRILLADSGSVVALIYDGSGTNDDLTQNGVRLIDRNGASWSYAYNMFIETPTISYGCGPTTLNWIDVVIDHGDRFVIRTQNGKEHTLEYIAAPRTGRWQKVVIAGVFCGVLIFFVRTVLRRRPAVESAVVEPVETTSPA